MPNKDYKFNNETYSINGTDELHAFLDKLYTANGELQVKLDSAPTLEQQLALWDKAKPHFEHKKEKIDYSLPALEVMKKCLEGNFDISDADEKTITYLFNKMLQAPTSETSEDNNSTDTSNNKNSNSGANYANGGTVKTPAKPKVPQGTKSTATSEEMGDAILQRRITGDITNTATTNGTK